MVSIIYKLKYMIFNVIEVCTHSVYNIFCVVAAYVFALIISCFEQIKLLDSSTDCSGSGNNTVMDASLEGESMACNKTSVLNSSGELNEVLSED